MASSLNELLVSKSVDVLNVFDAQKGAYLWVNEIVRRVRETTGSKDTPAIKESIRLLERAYIIETIPSDKHRQKEIKVPTDLGKEILNLIYALRSCNLNYVKLKELIIEYNLDLGENKDRNDARDIVIRKLMYKRWDDQDIANFDDIMLSAFRMECIYRANILNSILHRYSSIKYEYEINQIADKIILKIIMDEIQSLFLLAGDIEELSFKFSSNNYYFNSEHSDRITDVPFVDTYDTIEEQIESFFLFEDSVLTNKVISNTIEKLTLSLFLLLRPDMKDIKKRESSLKWEVGIRREQQKILSKIKSGKPFSDKDIRDLTAAKLRDIYSRFLQSELYN